MQCLSLRVSRLTRGLETEVWIEVGKGGGCGTIAIDKHVLMGRSPKRTTMTYNRLLLAMVDISRHSQYLFSMDFEGKGPNYQWGTYLFEFKRPMQICPSCELPYSGSEQCNACQEEKCLNT